MIAHKKGINIRTISFQMISYCCVIYAYKLRPASKTAINIIDNIFQHTSINVDNATSECLNCLRSASSFLPTYWNIFPGIYLRTFDFVKINIVSAYRILLFNKAFITFVQGTPPQITVIEYIRVTIMNATMFFCENIKE